MRSLLTLLTLSLLALGTCAAHCSENCSGVASGPSSWPQSQDVTAKARLLVLSSTDELRIRPSRPLVAFVGEHDALAMRSSSCAEPAGADGTALPADADTAVKTKSRFVLLVPTCSADAGTDAGTDAAWSARLGWTVTGEPMGMVNDRIHGNCVFVGGPVTLQRIDVEQLP